MKAFALALVLILSCLLFGSAQAQELTPEALPTAVVTAAPPVVVDPEPVPDVVTVPSWLMQNFILLLPLLTVGALLFQSVQHNKSLKLTLEQMDKRSQDAVEAAHEALPESAQDVITWGIDLADKIVDELSGVVAWARKVTDGAPNADPEPARIGKVTWADSTGAGGGSFTVNPEKTTTPQGTWTGPGYLDISKPDDEAGTDPQPVPHT